MNIENAGMGGDGVSRRFLKGCGDSCLAEWRGEARAGGDCDCGGDRRRWWKTNVLAERAAEATWQWCCGGEVERKGRGREREGAQQVLRDSAAAGERRRVWTMGTRRAATIEPWLAGGQGGGGRGEVRDGGVRGDQQERPGHPPVSPFDCRRCKCVQYVPPYG